MGWSGTAIGYGLADAGLKTAILGVTLAAAHATLFAPMVAAGALDPVLAAFSARRFDVPAAA